MIACNLCGTTAPDRNDMAEHLATEHPDQWEMAVQVAALQLIGAHSCEQES